jgi:hypothetical protein
MPFLSFPRSKVKLSYAPNSYHAGTASSSWRSVPSPVLECKTDSWPEIFTPSRIPPDEEIPIRVWRQTPPGRAARRGPKKWL